MASSASSSKMESSSSPMGAVSLPPLENVAAVAVAPIEGVAAVAPAPVVVPLSANAGAAPLAEGYDSGPDETEEPQDPNAPKRELTEDEKYVQSVRKRWKTMTNDQLRETMTNPLGAAELVREASRMHEEQLQIIASYMTDAQIASTIPSLQLQHQGALVQGFTAPQIRQCVRSIAQGDRQLLLQNITLITASETDPSKDDEIQGIIGFIDPLAMGTYFSYFSSRLLHLT